MAENLKVELDTRDVKENEVYHSELLEKSGDTQTPFLVDSEKDVMMAESSDIIEYMRENYAKTAGAPSAVMKPRIHVGGSVCESCEG